MAQIWKFMTPRIHKGKKMKKNEKTFNILTGSGTGTLNIIAPCKKKSNGVMGSHIEVTKWCKMAKIAFFWQKSRFFEGEYGYDHHLLDWNWTHGTCCNQPWPEHGSEGSWGRAWRSPMGSKWSKWLFSWQKSFFVTVQSAEIVMIWVKIGSW